MRTKSCNSHLNLLNSLSSLIKETELRIRAADDLYFTENANYFCKSFLITACTYLESYLKGVASIIVAEAETRLKENLLATNLVRWSLEKGNLKLFKDEQFSLNISEKDIDDNLSGNVDRTLLFFKKLGIYLESNPSFVDKKDKIGPIILKRNNLVHYNDDASDMSLGDILRIVTELSEYIQVIDAQVSNFIQPCLTNPFI